LVSDNNWSDLFQTGSERKLANHRETSDISHMRFRLGLMHLAIIMAVFLLIAFSVSAHARVPRKPIPSPSPSPTPSPSPSVKPEEFVDELEKDFTLRTIGQLQITNMRGNVVVQGWAMDKIRVRAKRKAMAANEEEAKALFSALDFRYQSSRENIELSAEYGRGLSIEDRLKERENPKTSMEMQIFAPANLKLRVWAVDGSVTVKGWNADLEVRTASGPILAESLRSPTVSLLCSTCAMQVKSARHAQSLRCMGGAGAITIQDVAGSQVYAESSTGAIRLAGVSGEQLYVSKSGPITGGKLRGRIEFHTQQAPVEIEDSRGFLSGRTETGNIIARMKDWVFTDRALIESVQGSIVLDLPQQFSGDVDVWSLSGKANIDFPLTPEGVSRASVGPEPTNHLLGRVGSGGGLLKIFSERGDIRVEHGT
jgi:hypothetical protein